MAKKKFDALRQKLLAQRRTILATKQAKRDAPDEAVYSQPLGDAVDVANEHDQMEKDINLQESEKRTLEGIADALARIEDGTYGKCEECGADIPEKRLLIVPHARLCVTCQEKEEKGEV
jgi:DnaK suppressor protein